MQGSVEFHGVDKCFEDVKTAVLARSGRFRVDMEVQQLLA